MLVRHNEGLEEVRAINIVRSFEREALYDLVLERNSGETETLLKGGNGKLNYILDKVLEKSGGGVLDFRGYMNETKDFLFLLFSADEETYELYYQCEEHSVAEFEQHYGKSVCYFTGFNSSSDHLTVKTVGSVSFDTISEKKLNVLRSKEFKNVLLAKILEYTGEDYHPDTELIFVG